MQNDKRRMFSNKNSDIVRNHEGKRSDVDCIDELLKIMDAQNQGASYSSHQLLAKH